jgi:hypothetical protein
MRYIILDLPSTEMNRFLKEYLKNREIKTPNFYSILSAKFTKSKICKCYSSD